VDKLQGQQVSTNTISTEFKHIDKTTKKSTTGVLSITLSLYEYANYESVNELECDIKLRIGEEEETKVIGDLDGFVIDRDCATRKGRKLWIAELLQDDEEFEHEQTSELCSAVKTFFTKTGKIRASFNDHADDLKATTIVWVDMFKLYSGDDTWQGKGIGPQIMELFHELIRDQVFKDEETVLCLLRPGRIPDEEIDNIYSDIEVEQKLQASYEKSGYETWVQSNVAEGNNCTYMAQVL
jgi:hypothetical protein